MRWVGVTALVLSSSSAWAFGLCGVRTGLQPSSVVPTNVGVLVVYALPQVTDEVVFESDDGETVFAAAETMDVAEGVVIWVTLDEPLEPLTDYTVYSVGSDPVSTRDRIAEVTTESGPDVDAPAPVALVELEGRSGRGGSTNDRFSELVVRMDQAAPAGGYLELQASEDGTFADPYTVLSAGVRLVYGDCGSELERGTSYDFRVRAVDAAGQASAWSDTERERFPAGCACSSAPTPWAWAWALLPLLVVSRRRA